MQAPDTSLRAPGSWPVINAVLLLWLGGLGLRLTFLAVPPVIPMIRDDLALSATEVGVLTGLPLALLALAAVPGSLLIARVGAQRTLVFGLLATALGSALRGLAPNIWLLYAATVVTAFGVAVMQPSLPPLVRAWLPDRIGFGTAVYANGLLVGEVLPVALTLTTVVPLVGGSWRGAFAVWAIPCIAIALIVAMRAPRGPSASTGQTDAGQKWWPDWRSGLVWRAGIMFGTVNALYFTVNAFIPDVLTRTGRPDLISFTLTVLNVAQLPTSLILLLIAGRLVRRVWPYVLSGIVSAAAVLGLMFGPPTIVVVSAGVIGVAGAAVLVLMLALPPLLSRPDDVHRLAAGMFTISYSCGLVVPVLSGIAWDLSGWPGAVFIPVLLGELALIVLAPAITGVRRGPEG